ncbi:hypothetical protein O5833_29170, partial [Escherichia coli]|nr:hypothetical protein [Escherichia coli]
ERYKSRPDYLRFKKRQETALNILANLEEFEEKELKKAKHSPLHTAVALIFSLIFVKQDDGVRVSIPIRKNHSPFLLYSV